jgi:hypothetical protein
VTNGCTGGYTPQQIRDGFLNGKNKGSGLTDGLPAQLQRDKTIIIGEMFANALNAGEIDGHQAIADMVAVIEAAQEVSAGQGRILIWALGCRPSAPAEESSTNPASTPSTP